MKAYLGIDAAAKRRGEPSCDVEWDSDKLVNGHVLIAGMTGAGKSHILRKLMRSWEQSAAEVGQAPRFHVFDIHGDMNIEGASSVMFSEQTDYGLNPLRVNSDPHFGGVKKVVRNFVNTMNSVMVKLGSKQEAALRNVLYDVYREHGFDMDDASTWKIDGNASRLVSSGADNRAYIDVPMAQKDEAKALGARWDPEARSWWVGADEYTGAITRWKPKTIGRTHPAIDDAMRHARRILQISFMGSDQKAITHLEIFNRATRNYQKRVLESMRRGQAGYEDMEKDQADLEKLCAKAIETFSDYAKLIRTGRELDDVMKFDSTDVLKGVVDRLENLDSIGVFKATPPPFDPSAQVWHYDLRSLGMIEQKLFVLFRLQELFAKGVERGEQDHIQDVLVLDEASRYVDDDPDNILLKISREARKFGIALVCASQSTTHFPEDFTSAVGTKIILGIDEGYWKGTASKMNLPEEALKWIQLQKSMMVQLKEKGQAKNAWRWTVIGDRKAA